jgi:hypothetical protein
VTGHQLAFTSRWSSAENLQMLVGKADAGDDPAIRLLYSRTGPANVCAL